MSYYLRREFYFDVHPPLGKMLIALVGLLSGYSGQFEFESGSLYPEDVNYTAMRVMLSMFGVGMVPLSFLSALEFGFGYKYALLLGVFVICENAFLTISRYILLDSMLLYFTVQSFYCLSCLKNESRGSVGWIVWLGLTGVSLGTVMSIKWVGLFSVAVVGLYTLADLWEELREPSLLIYGRHFLIRAIFLILLPLLIYILSFKLHFLILTNSGPGDAQMSSLFQSQLNGNEFHKSPPFVVFGSRVTMKNNGYSGGLLHSHVQQYPGGSQQQQVTGYHYRDSNNEWFIRHVRGEETSSSSDSTGESDELEYIKDGSKVRLVHVETGRNLHSHPIAAPVSRQYWEVSGYGNDTLGDENDDWQIELLDSSSSKEDRLKTLVTRFRLKHLRLGCFLKSHHVGLPQWGFKQSEVVCDKKNNKYDSNQVWNIEQHFNPRLQEGTPQEYRTSFMSDFLDLNVGMMTSNNALTQDPNKEPDGLTSSPSDWPLLYVGLRMCGWGNAAYKVYLLGNPILWWFGFFSLILYLLIYTVYLVLERRGFIKVRSRVKELEEGKWFLVGWVLHYLPFCLMSRVTYLHHYFPALYFCLFMFVFLLEHFLKYFNSSSSGSGGRMIELGLYVGVLGVVVGVFMYFSGLSYGFDGPAEEFRGRKWREGWNIYNE